MTTKNKAMPSKAFDIANYAMLALLGLSCLLPIIHLLAVSLSDSAASTANQVRFLPKGLQLSAYEEVFKTSGFIRSLMVSVLRVLAGTSLNMLLVLLAAYPLSKNSRELKGRNGFMWFIFFPMLFSGGLIPTFILIRDLRLMDSFWVMILPWAVPIFNVILMMNFFRGIPKSFYESAVIDGANHAVILFKIYVPLSTAAVATLVLFSCVNHWNDWFTGVIYLNSPEKWPLQTYLRQLVISINYNSLTKEDLDRLKKLSGLTFKSAQLFVGILPVLCVYPFLQKYFTKGIVMGAVKE